MRSIWKGSISFGLVNVPVKLYSATEDHDVSLHQVHDKDGGRIRYQRTCEVCGKEVAYSDIDKAFQSGDETVILTEDDISSLPEERSREIAVQEFVPNDQLDPIMFDRSYFLAPDAQATKPYVLLRSALEDTDRTAIVEFSLRQKTRLGALRVHGEVLLLQTLLWDDEVREAKFSELDEPAKVSGKEREMAAQLVQSLENDFSPEKFSDEYQDQLKKLVEAQLAEGESLDTEATFGETEEKTGGEVIDLMEALKRSVDSARKPGSTRKKAVAGQKASGKKSADKEKPADKKSGTKKSAPTKESTGKSSQTKRKAG